MFPVSEGGDAVTVEAACSIIGSCTGVIVDVVGSSIDGLVAAGATAPVVGGDGTGGTVAPPLCPGALAMSAVASLIPSSISAMLTVPVLPRDASGTSSGRGSGCNFWNTLEAYVHHLQSAVACQSHADVLRSILQCIDVSCLGSAPC